MSKSSRALGTCQGQTGQTRKAAIRCCWEVGAPGSGSPDGVLALDVVSCRVVCWVRFGEKRSGRVEEMGNWAYAVTTGRRAHGQSLGPRDVSHSQLPAVTKRRVYCVLCIRIDYQRRTQTETNGSRSQG